MSGPTPVSLLSIRIWARKSAKRSVHACIAFSNTTRRATTGRRAPAEPPPPAPRSQASFRLRGGEKVQQPQRPQPEHEILNLPLIAKPSYQELDRLPLDLRRYLKTPQMQEITAAAQ